MLLKQVALMYLFFLAIRIRGYVRRWHQPQLRGPEWFFSVNVQPGFYDGPGRKILHRYWMRMFIPFVLDIPIWMAFFLPGLLPYVVWVLVAQAALIHVNHVFSVDLAERQARQFAVPEAEQPVTSLIFSLKTRRLSDYSNHTLELVLASSTLFALVWLVRDYVTTPELHDLRLVFGEPAFLLYAQLGFLFVKSVIVAWRTPVPETQADEHLKAREEARKLYLQVCDWFRITYTLLLLFWPVMLNAAAADRGRFTTYLFSGSLVIAMVLTVWQEIRRKKVLAVALRARPIKLPEFLGQPEAVKWPLCYQPTAPMLVLKGARGYSLNMANNFTQLGAAYLAGFVVLMAVLRMWR